MATTDKSALEGKVAAELHQMAADLGIEGHKGLKKADLVERILEHTNGEASKTTTTPAPAETFAPPPAEADQGEGYADTPSGNGDTRQRPPEGRPRDDRQREDRREGGRPHGGRPEGGQREGGPRRRPSREERVFFGPPERE